MREADQCSMCRQEVKGVIGTHMADGGWLCESCYEIHRCKRKIAELQAEIADIKSKLDMP